MPNFPQPETARYRGNKRDFRVQFAYISSVEFSFSNSRKEVMNQAHTRSLKLAGMICLATVMAVQLGCETKNKNKNNSPAKGVIRAPTAPGAAPDADPEAENMIVPPTDPAAKTETSAKALPEFGNATFEAPLRLTVGNSPLNTAAKQMYPSPAMFDVDHDGKSELVVGDIFGSLNVYENQNDGEGDPVWSSHNALTSTNGEAIKVPNW